MILQINKLVRLADEMKPIEKRRKRTTWTRIYFDCFDCDYHEMNVVSIRLLVYLVDELNDVFQRHSDEKLFHDRMDSF